MSANTHKYKVKPHLNIKEYLDLPNFEIKISKNSDNVYECHIKDFRLYVHSAQKDYDSAFSKIQGRVQGLVITHILEALSRDMSLAVYGKKAGDDKKKIIKKLENSYHKLIESNECLENFIKSTAIPFSYSDSEKKLIQIKKKLNNTINRIKKEATMTENDIKEILLEVLSNITLFHFKPIA